MLPILPIAQAIGSPIICSAVIVLYNNINTAISYPSRFKEVRVHWTAIKAQRLMESCPLSRERERVSE